PFSWPTLQPTLANFDGLQLTGAWLQPTAVANTAVTVALRWQRTSSEPNRYNVRLTPINRQGMAQGQQSALLLDSDGRPTDQWPIRQLVTTTPTLPIRLGSGPQTWQRRLGVDQLLPDGPTAVELSDGTGAGQGIFLSL